MNFDKNLLKNTICFDNLTDSANQIAGFCQIVVTLHVFEEIFCQNSIIPPYLIFLKLPRNFRVERDF